MEMLFKYMRENVDNEIRIGDNDVLCVKCFCAVSFYAQGTLDANASGDKKKECNLPVQNELECLLAQFSDSQIDVDSNDFDSCDEKAYHVALSKLLGDFLNGKACLFGEIYDIYLEVIRENYAKNLGVIRENYAKNLGASAMKSPEVLLSDFLCSLGPK